MTRVCLYTRISTDEENQPTSLGFPAGTAGGVLQGAGGLADHRPPRRPRDRHQARPARPASSARPRPPRPNRSAPRLQDRPAHPQGASAREHRRGARHPQRDAALGDRAIRHRLSSRPDDAADARRVRRVRARHDRRPRHRRDRAPRPRRPLVQRTPPFGYTLNEEKQLIPDPSAPHPSSAASSLYMRGRLGPSRSPNSSARASACAVRRLGHPAVHLVLSNRGISGASAGATRLPRPCTSR